MTYQDSDLRVFTTGNGVDPDVSAAPPEPIAIIGIGCRFPGRVTNAHTFWQLLTAGVDATCDVPPDRWDIGTFYDPDPTKPGKVIVHRGGFLDQVDQFDAHFFGISPREAACLDPQQRLLLMTSWEALEDAGLDPERLAGSNTGVFIGAFTLDYKVLQFNEHNRDLLEAHTATGSMMTMVSNRISYAFDFRGPSFSVDTACSSSLVAIHLACRSLWNNECALALAGGVNVMITPEYTIVESKGGFLCPDGRCKAFDARANGYARGEGAGVVVLKPLPLALADGDPIYALIRGSAINQDGHTNGITVPRGDAQIALMRAAYRRAGVAPGEIQYVEAHGTGTPVGDPIEAHALGTVLSAGRPAGSRCVIGSVKTNIGHLEAGAGVAGLIKAALCLKHRQIPPHLHFQTPNPQIDFAALGLHIPTTLEPWPEHAGPARAGVNSFGFGGTNAHVVLEEAPAVAAPARAATPAAPDRPYLLPLSARSPAALLAQARQYRAVLANTDESAAAPLHDLCYTASLRRSHHDHRLALVVHSHAEGAALLDAFLADEARPGLVAGQRTPGHRPRIVFVFTGMGPQWWAMGRQLMQQEPLFRETIERCDALFQRHADWSLIAELLADEEHSRMAETQVAQPTNFAIQVALLALWRAWGIAPDAIIGHSAGEIAAVYAAGALSLEDAVRVIYHRSRLQHTMAGKGKMMAVGLSAEEIQPELAAYAGRVSIGGINSPSSVTLAGETVALAAIAETLQQRQVFCRLLRVDVPYHCHFMDPLRDELLEVLQGLDPQPATVPIFSTALGRFAEGHAFGTEYWWFNVRNTVLFAQGIDACIDAGYDTFLEVGPHPVLANAISECLMRRERQGTIIASLRRGDAERETMLQSLGTLYTLGCPVDWHAFYPVGGRHVPLPTYPWQTERYWVESEESARKRLGQHDHPLLGRPLKLPHPAWELELNRRNLPYLNDHRIQGATVYPGAAYVEMGLATARGAFGTGRCILEDIEFRRALFLPDGDTPQVQVVLDPDEASFEIYSRPQGAKAAWVLHATGTLRRLQDSRAPREDLAEIRRRCAEELAGPACYQQFQARGFHYGPCFQGITRLWRGAGEALGHIQTPDALHSGDHAYQLHPAMLDACFQVLIAIDSRLNTPDNPNGAEIFLPVGIDRVRVYRQPGQRLWSHARIVEQSAKAFKGDILLLDDDGEVLAEIRGFRVKSLDHTPAAAAADRLDDWLYEVCWQPRDHAPQEARQPAQPGSWLIFADGSGVGQALAARLEERGETCMLVAPGDSYRALEPGRRYQINPQRVDDFRRLLADMPGGANPPCRGVVHLWSLNAAPPAQTNIAALDAAQEQGTLAVMRLVQALAQSGMSPRLWLVTRGAQLVGDQVAPVAVAQAPLWGLGRVVGYQENVGLWGGAIDLDPSTPADEAAMLLDELWSPDGEDQVAFRDGQRYVARLEHSTHLTTPLPAQFRPDGSYIITGGFGALGMLVARWMVEHGARRLILMGRSALPARSTWHRAGDCGPQAERIAFIRELERKGASVHVAAVDVTSEAQLTAFLGDYLQEGWPPIRGVIYAAGIVRDQILLEMDTETFKAVLRPKMIGAWLLHHLLEQEEASLDFFVLFSSVASLVTSTGQANYAAGNAFLDALAHYRRAQGLPALSINWGPWAVGMVEDLNLVEHYARRGMDAITAEPGLQVLGRLFGQNLAQVAVLSANWPVVLEYYPQMPPLFAHLGAQEQAQEADAAAGDTRGERFIQRVRRAEPAVRQELIESHLQELVARVLRLDRTRLDRRQPLNTLGMDSMMATELKNRIELSLEVSLSVVDLLRGLSVTQLAAQLVPQVQDDTAITEMLAGKDHLPAEVIQRLATQVDAETLAQLLADIEHLSEEEVQALLETGQQPD